MRAARRPGGGRGGPRRLAAQQEREEELARLGQSVVVFPCGHAFHEACVPELACLECLDRGLKQRTLVPRPPVAHSRLQQAVATLVVGELNG